MAHTERDRDRQDRAAERLGLPPAPPATENGQAAGALTGAEPARGEDEQPEDAP